MKANNKAQKGELRYSVSEEAIDFIRRYVLPVKPVSYIDGDIFDEIFDMAEEWELDMIDKDGNDKKDNPFMERDVMGMNFISEISGQDGEPDLDDLNRRLGFVK